MQVYKPSMVMVNEDVTWLPAASVAVNVTVVTPIENGSPELWLDVTVTTPELSLAVGDVQVTTAVAEPLSVSWVTSTGVLDIDGFSLSVQVW